VKGLLHRLAARAAGATAAVRSDARLPFGRTSLGLDLGPNLGSDLNPELGRELSPELGRDAAHAGVEQPFAMDAGAPAPDASAVFAQPRDNLAGDTPPTSMRDPPPLTPMLDPLPRWLQRAPADASPSTAPDTRSDAHPLLGDASAPNSNPNPPLNPGVNPPPNPPRRLVDSTPADPEYASYRAKSPTETAESAERSGAAPAPEALRSDVAARFAREPSLLIPLAAQHPAASPAITAPATTRWPAMTNSATHAVASAEPSEVHIHIGRIEVTAMHEAAPPRRPPVPRPSPMSLDAYLAKRGRT
jgi:hypothetical protein